MKRIIHSPSKSIVENKLTVLLPEISRICIYSESSRRRPELARRFLSAAIIGREGISYHYDSQRLQTRRGICCEYETRNAELIISLRWFEHKLSAYENRSVLYCIILIVYMSRLIVVSGVLMQSAWLQMHWRRYSLRGMNCSAGVREMAFHNNGNRVIITLFQFLHKASRVTSTSCIIK